MGVRVWSQGAIYRHILKADGSVEVSTTYRPSMDGVTIRGDTYSRPCPAPQNLISSMTGRSHSEYTSVYYPINFDQPTGTGVIRTAPQDFGCNSLGPWLISSSEETGLYAEVENRLLADIRGVKWDLATSLAEFGETVRFVNSVMKDLVTYYKVARKGDLLALSNLYHKRDHSGKRRPPWPARVRDRYLAFRYAVRPLVGDLDSALAEFARTGLQPVVRRMATKDRIRKSGEIVDYYQGNPKFLRKQGSSETITATRVVYITISPDVEDIKRLGFTNLASVLWNVTPFSFMLDWVLPIGDAIASIDATTGVGLTASYRVVKKSWNTYAFMRDGGSTQKGRQYVRTVNLGLPSFQFRLKPSLDVLKLVDTAAIISQLRSQPGPRGFRA